MYRNKKDVDKHVDNLMFKLSPKDFTTRTYSIARLYFEVEDYRSCQKYVEQYLTQKSNNAAANKLLGQAFQKLGDKEKALEQFKISLDIDPTQANTILDVCELLADDDVSIDAGRAMYWCEKAETMFPKHPVTFRLRERLLTVVNPDPESLVKLLKTEIEIRPKDVVLHIRLLKHLLCSNNIKEAFEHSCNIELDNKFFSNNYLWYESLTEILKFNHATTNNWLEQLLLLTVKERICVLSLTEVPNISSKSLLETIGLLHSYDQAIDTVAKSGPAPGFGEFHNILLQHHRGQLAFHAATCLLKKAKKGLLHWREAKEYSAPLMLIAWQTVPVDTKVNWLTHAPVKQQNAVHRWYLEGSYRCSQSGHFLLSGIQDKSQIFLDQVSQFCSGTQWKDKLYEKLYFAPEQQTKKQSSYLMSNSFNAPLLRLPRKTEVQAYDDDAQREYPNSLHHFVWLLLNYNNYAEFRCTLFDMLTSTDMITCGPETLNKMDVFAFLFTATLTTQKLRDIKSNHIPSLETLSLLPANITNLLSSLPQTKWWDCAYKFSQNELGEEYTDIRSTLSRGIEVLRCIDNHGLHPELLCSLGRIFVEKAKKSNLPDEKNNFEARAHLYYSSAIPILEKLKLKIGFKIPEKRMFDYTPSELSMNEINLLLEESKLQIAHSHFNEGEYEKVVSLLSKIKSPEAYYRLSETYKKIAMDEKALSKNVDNYASLLRKAKHYAYKSLESIKYSEDYKNKALCADIQSLIEELEACLNKIDMDVMNDVESLDEFGSMSEIGPMRSKPNHFQNVSSTPKQTRHNYNLNTTNYRSALDSQVLESASVDQLFLERIEKQIKNLQKRDTTINDFMELTRDWFEENRKLGNQIISTINSNIEHTSQQFKLLKISVDQVKEQIDECKSESRDVAELKKQITELKREVNKLKKISTDHTTNESDLCNLEDDYRTNDNTSNFGAQLPFTGPQVVPPFSQRLMPPFSAVPSNPYQLYGQNFYNLYSQYSQFAQPPAVPGAPQIFDPTRTQVNYPGLYPTPDQMYLDVAHLVPPTLPSVPTVPTLSAVPTVPTAHSNISITSTMPSTSVAPPPMSVSISKVSLDSTETQKSLPVNVVITSSDPLPTCTTTPAPVLSVTIPQKHIKGSPHNYQIPMPSSNDTKIVTPPVFAFPSCDKSISTTTSSILNWNSKSSFLSSQAENTLSTLNVNASSKGSDINKSVGDGLFPGISPNTSINKSRTLSERSNTSIENYDPCPDFKPIIPLPAEVKITTGEENEIVIFKARAKLFRFVDKQWKERGIGEMKLLKHKITGKVRVLMRREQVHKICANHIVSPEMVLSPYQPSKNEFKAYCWGAHDFAEETVILEKFCIKFKTDEIGKQFYEKFEGARKELVNSNKVGADTKNLVNISKPLSAVSGIVASPNSNDQAVDNKLGKTAIGGFTFSGTPTFKSTLETSESEPKHIEAPKDKINVFSEFNFTSGNSFPFSNNTSLAKSVTPIKPDDSTKLNTSDVIEDFEPTTEFKPVVPLPALVDQKTGEEDEVLLFEHRAKLLRFDILGKEWKERGLGNIKLLVHKDNNQKLRLLMRREQIMKVCCNHSVTKEMTFQKMPNIDKAVTWCAKDFSEGELITETFCIRFKTAQICDDFLDAIKQAQNKIGDDSKAAKEVQNAAKQNIQIGFGNKFKPKPGSWYCDSCYTNNLETFLKCACCGANSPKSLTNVSTSSDTPAITSGWGDKFKPKSGSWECKACLIRNEAGHENCVACNTSKDGTVKTSDIKLNDAPKFNFFIPSTAQGSIQSNPNALKTTESSIFGTNNVQKKFTFGIPNTETPLNFGMATKSLDSQNVFGAPNITFKNENPINYSINKNETENITTTPGKSALLPTPDTTVTSFGKVIGNFEFSFKPKTVIKGKSPVKSPKDHKGDDSDENEYVSEDEGHHIHFSPVIPMPEKIEVVTGEEDEEELYSHRAKLFVFNKEWKERGIGNVKILKHKITGNLRVLMRRDRVHKICLNHALVSDITYKPKDDKSWLFFVNDFSEGELVPQNLCLRFKNKEIAVQFKDAIEKAISGKTDISENKNKLDKKTEDPEDVIFINEIQSTNEDKQRAKELMLPEHFYNYKVKEPCRGCRGCDDDHNTKDSVKPQAEEELMKNSKIDVFKQDLTPPLKTTTSGFQSPSGSVYGTPNNNDRSINTTMFRTPLSTIKSNTTQSASSSTFTFNTPENDSTDKENTLTDTLNTQVSPQSTSFVSGGIQQNQSMLKTSILAAPKLSTLSSNNATSTKSIFGFTEPKFSLEENKSVFVENKSDTTALSSNKPVFTFNLQNTQGDSNLPDTQTKSIFSDTNISQVNFFSNTSQGDIFGPAALKNIQSKPLFNTGPFSFGSVTEPNQDKPKSSVFGVASVTEKKEDSSGKIVNENIVKQNDSNGKNTQGQFETFNIKNNSVLATSKLGSVKKSVETAVQPGSEAKESLFKVDNSLTFEGLSTSGPGFGTQKKDNFQWEGAGQQLFTNTSARESGDKSNDAESMAEDACAAGGTEEEYDPHYEPIVPLPDKIVVTTGEEDEIKLFSERCKLFRYDEKSRNWKERGIGEIKILYHLQRNSYRLLLRREQVHKTVLNMLIFMDMELLPMNNSDRAWIWVGVNYAESAGEKETLAVRFKTVDLAQSFHEKVTLCVRKLQALAAEALRKEKDVQETVFESVAPLRLPKHLEEGARADINTSPVTVASPIETKPEAVDANKKEDDVEQPPTESSEVKQVHFEGTEDDHGEYGEEDYDPDYEHTDDYGYYYGNEEEDSPLFYPRQITVSQDGSDAVYDDTQVQVSFDHEICSPKIVVTELNTGEILADMLIHTDTEFRMSGDTCSWSGIDYTSNPSVKKTMNIAFTDSNTAMEFYDSCETSKAATYASTDPES